MYWCMNSVDEYLSKCGNTSTVRVFKDKDYYYIQLCPTIHNTCWNFTRLECQNIYDVCKSYLNLQGQTTVASYTYYDVYKYRGYNVYNYTHYPAYIIITEQEMSGYVQCHIIAIPAYTLILESLERGCIGLSRSDRRNTSLLN